MRKEYPCYLEKDANRNPISAGFYKNINNRKIIELRSTALGFSVFSGLYGEKAKGFDLSQGKNYQRMSLEEIKKEIESINKRERWLREGLESNI